MSQGCSHQSTDIIILYMNIFIPPNHYFNVHFYADDALVDAFFPKHIQITITSLEVHNFGFILSYEIFLMA